MAITSLMPDVDNVAIVATRAGGAVDPSGLEGHGRNVAAA